MMRINLAHFLEKLKKIEPEAKVHYSYEIKSVSDLLLGALLNYLVDYAT